MKRTINISILLGIVVFLADGCSPPSPSSPPTSQPVTTVTTTTQPVATVTTTTQPEVPEDFTIPDIGIIMKPIPAGKFTMGSFEDEASFVGDSISATDERQHPVEISRPFWISTYEITQKQWLSLTGIGIQSQFDKMASSNEKNLLFGCSWVQFKDLIFLIFDNFDDPSEVEEFLLKYGLGIFSDQDPFRPMSCVSYDEALQFCRLLTATERAAGRLREGHIYSLPTEAQWEYVCRAGTVTPFAGDVIAMGVFYKVDKGSEEKTDLKTYYPLSRFDPKGKVNFKGQANKWGIVDMHGNLDEWCLDWYGEYPMDSRVVKDPTGPNLGKARVVRGGSFLSSPAECRSAYRYSAIHGARSITLGFRVVLTPAR